MKKMIPMLVSAAIAMPMVALADGPTVYGKFNTALLMTDNGTTDDVRLANSNSRLGVKGSIDLDAGLKAVYQLEYGIDPDEKGSDLGGHAAGVKDNGNSGIFTQRNGYVGISGGFGTILGGSHDTPLKMAQGKVDLFNDLPNADMTAVVNGEIRGQDVVAYISPDFSGLKVIAASQAPDSGDAKGGTSVSVSYSADNLYVALAMDSELGTLDETRVAATYTMGGLQLGALFNQSEKSDGSTDSESGMLLSAGYTMDKFTYKLQLVQGDEQTAGEEMVAVGVDYALGGKSALFAYYSSIDCDACADATTTLAAGLSVSF
ncbi:MAG: porin [Pseudomonadota bacterium]